MLAAEATGGLQEDTGDTQFLELCTVHTPQRVHDGGPEDTGAPADAQKGMHVDAEALEHGAPVQAVDHTESLL